MTIKRVLLGLLVAAGLTLPALGALGAGSAEAAINRLGADYAPSPETRAISHVGGD